MFTTRCWGVAAVLLHSLLLQNCQSNSLRATEEELSASPSSASVMREHTPSEPMAMQPLVLPSVSLVAHVSSSRFSTTLASEEVRSAAPSSIPLGPVARHALAAVGNSLKALYALPAAAMLRVSHAIPLSNAPDHSSSSDGPRVRESKVKRVLREMPSDEEEDSKPSAQQRSTNLASEDDLANKELRAGEEEAEEGAKNVRFALKTLGEVHFVEQRGQSGDPLTILLDVASSQPDKAIQFLDVLLVAAQDNGCRQQALEALGKVSQASPDMLSECLPSLRAAAKGGDKDVRLLSLKTLGEVEWRHYFGEVEPAPDLPKDMVTILDSACPFWPDKKVRDTHLLALIPATVDGEPFTLNLLGELIERPKNGGKETGYRDYKRTVKAQIGIASPAASYWLLMTCDVLPGSRNKRYADQKQLVVGHASRTGLPYEVPKALEAATVILTHHVRNGERLYSNSPWTYTRCQELIRSSSGGEFPPAIGGLGSSGLDVFCYASAYRSCGVAGCRKF
jgi:hypothetical protein